MRGYHSQTELQVPFRLWMLFLSLVGASASDEFSRGPQARIINGQTAPKDRFTWFVRTFAAVSANGVAEACGGSLISPDLIITAAHCGSLVTVNVNAYNEDQVDKSLQRRIVANVRHPNFPQELGIDYDVMISKLETPVTDIQPIQLNFDNNVPSTSGEELKIMGFGTTVPGPDAPIVQSKVLQVAPTNYVTFEDCAVATDPTTGYKYGTSTQNTVVDPYWLCTVRSEPLTATCYGDSGGPVVREGNSPSEDLLVGVISGGSGYCGNPNLPLWNNRVSYHQEWIKTVGCDMSESPPAYWNCATATTGGNAGLVTTGGNAGLVIVVIPVLCVVLAVIIGFYMWRRRKNKMDLTKDGVKNPDYDVERQPHIANSDEDNDNKKDGYLEPAATVTSSPGSSEASPAAPKKRQHSGAAPEVKSPLSRGPCGLLNRKPSMEPKENDKHSSLFGRKLSMDPNNKKQLFESLPEENAETTGWFGRRPSMDPDNNERGAGWLGRLPTLAPKNDTKDMTEASFLPTDIADMVDKLDKELDKVLLDGKNDTSSSKNDRGRQKPIDRSTNISDRAKSRCRSVDRRGTSTFPDARGRSRKSAHEDRRSRSLERIQVLADDHVEKKIRSYDDNAQKGGGARKRSAERKPKSLSTLTETKNSHPSHTGPRRTPPRTSSDVVKSSSSKPTPRTRQARPTNAPPPRTKSDTLALASSRQATYSDNNRGPNKGHPLCTTSATTPLSSGYAPSTGEQAERKRPPPPRTKSDTTSSSFGHAPSTREKAEAKRAPPPSTKSDTTSSSFAGEKAAPKRVLPPRTKSDILSSSNRHAPESKGQPEAASPRRTLPPRTKSDIVSSSSGKVPHCSIAIPVRPVGKPSPRRRSDNVPRATTSNGSDSHNNDFRSVFDQWKQREEKLLTPVVTKNSDGTVTVSKSRRNEEGVGVMTKTKYASAELARRHGVAI